MSNLRLVILVLTWHIHSGNGECSPGCSSCSGSICKNCESTYYLSGEDCHRCPDNCYSCEDFDHCTSCLPNNWNLHASCLPECNNNCANQECQDNNGYCHQCKAGLYGLQCQRNCSLCENALCDLRVCTYGCKLGYYDFNDGSEIFCQSCRSNCKTCRDSYTCDVCNDGFYLYKYISNNRVHVDCFQCLDSSQSCLDYCVIQDCDKCHVLADKIDCAKCSEGFELKDGICLRNISKCSRGCSSDCDDNGICLGSCNIGWTGERCSESCASECLTCAKNNSKVCEQCKEDYYTTSCNIKCSGHCNKTTNKPTCNIDNGYCLNDCDRTYWGPFCNKACQDGCADDGMSEICERSNGSCKLKCKDGFTGPTCDTFFLTTPTNKSEGTQSTTKEQTSTEKVDNGRNDAVKKDEDSNTIIIGPAAGAGVLALILSAVFIFCFVKRR